MDDSCDIVMRQTDYDKETAEKKIQEHGGDVKKVIREFLGISNTTTNSKKSKSTQQQIYSQIRNF